jgi:hypothetical protein
MRSTLMQMVLVLLAAAAPAVALALEFAESGSRRSGGHRPRRVGAERSITRTTEQEGLGWGGEGK